MMRKSRRHKSRHTHEGKLIDCVADASDVVSMVLVQLATKWQFVVYVSGSLMSYATA